MINEEVVAMNHECQVWELLLPRLMESKEQSVEGFKKAWVIDGLKSMRRLLANPEFGRFDPN